MSLEIRRVVTGHDEEGRSRVLIDGPTTNVVSKRTGHASTVVWSTEGFPVDNDGDRDPTDVEVPTALENGTVFRVVHYGPGVTPRQHRTDSIDYGVVIAGQIDLELDDEVVTLRTGDLLVQRGTIHSWTNHGPEPAVVAFALIAAKPVTVDGRTLEAEG